MASLKAIEKHINFAIVSGTPSKKDVIIPNGKCWHLDRLIFGFETTGMYGEIIWDEAGANEAIAVADCCVEFTEDRIFDGDGTKILTLRLYNNSGANAKGMITVRYESN